MSGAAVDTVNAGIDVSVVTGTGNRLALLRAMIESVRLSAAGLRYEIVIVDTGSTDGTLEWLRNERNVVLIEHGERRGAVIAFNTACAAARGKYVVIANDDMQYMGDTIARAFNYLENPANGGVGQVAFKNNVDNPNASRVRAPLDYFGGYLYGQCCMTRKWLGDLAGWWGDGYFTYGGDTQLGMRVWELGYSVVHVAGCEILDHVTEDDLRKSSAVNASNDTKLFLSRWTNRLPNPSQWKPAATRERGENLTALAEQRALRGLRFKTVPKGARPRIGLVDALARLGEAGQVNQTAAIAQYGLAKFQSIARDLVREQKPDLLILQAHSADSVLVETVRDMRRDNPNMVVVNFNGDARIPLPPFCAEMAKVCDLTLVVSPDMFEHYHALGARNVAYWPISYESDYAEAIRGDTFDSDVAFLGSHYPRANFPDSQLRADAVNALLAQFNIALHGMGWRGIGAYRTTTRTDEDHKQSAQIYARSKLALSVSHFNDLYGYSSDRLYMICATGCPALVKRFPGMEAHGFVDGATCIAWDSVAELIAKARYYLADENAAKREAIGAAGRALTLSVHNWDARVKELLTMLRVSAPVGAFGAEKYIAANGLDTTKRETRETQTAQDVVTIRSKSKNASISGVGARAAGRAITGGNAIMAGNASKTLSLPGRAGMELIRYTGESSGKMPYYGAKTGTRYYFGLSRPLGYVDAADLQGFLEVREGHRTVFAREQNAAAVQVAQPVSVVPAGEVVRVPPGSRTMPAQTTPVVPPRAGLPAEGVVVDEPQTGADTSDNTGDSAPPDTIAPGGTGVTSSHIGQGTSEGVSVIDERDGISKQEARTAGRVLSRFVPPDDAPGATRDDSATVASVAVDATESAIALAGEFGLDIKAIRGTGRNGRITATDVRRAQALLESEEEAADDENDDGQGGTVYDDEDADEGDSADDSEDERGEWDDDEDEDD